MNAEQAIFDFNPPAAAPDEVEALVSYLHQQGPVWTTAKQIHTALGINDRRLRVLRQSARGRIISGPGCPGYRHVHHCTIDQIREAAARKKSQIRAMVADYIADLRLANRLLNQRP